MEDTQVRENGSRTSAEENFEGLLKLEVEVRVAHGYKCNENIDLIQEGYTCVDIFYNLANTKIKQSMTPQDQEYGPL